MHHRILARLAAAAAALVLPLAALRADVVTLDDGRVIEGEIVSAAGAPVIELKTTSGGLVAVQRFDAAHVVKIEHGPSARQQALAKIASERAALGDGGPAEPWVALARRARELGDTMLAKELSGEAIARDRQNPDAHRLLGDVRQNGVWMRPREAAAARGEVFFRGRWVRWTEQEATLASEQKAREDAEAQRRKLLEQRAADAALAASEAQAAQPPVYSYSSSYGYGTYPYVPRVLYWAPSSYGYCQNQAVYPGGLMIHATGHTGSTSWSLNWNW